LSEDRLAQELSEVTALFVGGFRFTNERGFRAVAFRFVKGAGTFAGAL
jgi:hypothetical protein